MALTVRVQGLRELGTAFKRMGETEGPPRIRDATKSAAELVAAAARSRAPRAPARRHAEGLLASKIKVKSSQRGSSVSISGLPYAAAVHWGWPKHHIKRNPFVLQAQQDEYNNIVEQFSQAIRELCASF